MKYIIPLLLLIAFKAQAQDTSRGIWQTTVSKDKILSASILLTKSDGSIITIPDAWKINIRNTDNKIAIIYPDSSRVIYKIVQPAGPVPEPTPIPEVQTSFGLMQQNANQLKDMQAVFNSTQIRTVRVPVFFYDNYKSLVADEYFKNGYNAQLNFNYKPTGIPVLFPTDTNFIRNQAEKFFQYYLPYKDQIPFVAVENEWDNEHYRDFTKTSIKDYITELKIVTEVGHKYGFKIADAGTTGTAIQSWFYSTLTGDSAKQYKQKYFVNTKFINPVSEFINGIREVHFDYLNVHWYNNNQCSGWFPLIVLAFKNRTNKNVSVSNEFGVKDTALWDCTIAEIKQAKMIYAIAYSGINAPDKAVMLTVSMLSQLK